MDNTLESQVYSVTHFEPTVTVRALPLMEVQQYSTNMYDFRPQMNLIHTMEYVIK